MPTLPEYFVYVKTKAWDDDDGSSTNTIQLRANSVTIATQKQVPSTAIPFSGLVTGESITAALDLGMAQKSISVVGYIVDSSITRHGRTRNMTAQEIAQLIHASVDSTGAAKHQALDELVILIPSKVNNNYEYWNPSTEAEEFIPWTFRARGKSGELDNKGVPARIQFPSSVSGTDHQGVRGFIRSFSTPLEAETVEISFNLEFEVAEIFP
tara:strand:- start:13 stop:645 length:633 start_codon:yes stop_codon:yes gene_type:complete